MCVCVCVYVEPAAPPPSLGPSVRVGRAGGDGRAGCVGSSLPATSGGLLWPRSGENPSTGLNLSGTFAQHQAVQMAGRARLVGALSEGVAGQRRRRGCASSSWTALPAACRRVGGLPLSVGMARAGSRGGKEGRCAVLCGI